MGAHTWQAFEAKAAEIAEAGKRLLIGDDGVAIAFLATASAAGTPHIAPVCPIFCDADLYLSAAAATPKIADLRGNPRYSLHAFLGASDEEFQISGAAREVGDEAERGRVIAAIPFGAFDASHPIFHLSVERALWAHWENPGAPDTRAVRRRWSADPRGS